MRWPWQKGGEEAEDGGEEGFEDGGPTRKEMQAAYKAWESAASASERADRRRAEKAGAGSSFWDREITIAAGKRLRRGKTETFTARGILRRVLTAPDGYVLGFSGFEVKSLEGVRICIGNDELGRAFHVRFGRRLVAKDADAAYCSVFMDGPAAGVVAYTGPASGIDASKLVKSVAGAGGGRPDKGASDSFAQASGLDASNMDKFRRAALEVLVD